MLRNANKKLSDKKVGDNVNGLGLVIKKASTYDSESKQDVSGLVIFTNTSSRNYMKMIKIDTDFENEVLKFKEDYDAFCKSRPLDDKLLKEKIASFNETAKSILEREKNLVIVEIGFNMLNKDLARAFIDNIKKPLRSDEVLELINNGGSNVFPCIMGFKNYQPKRYLNAGREVAAPLLNLFFKHDCEPLLIEALAINSTHSPVGMYLKYGFEPISHDRAEIIKTIMESPQGFDYKEPVRMYLPEKSKLKALVLRMNPLKEIFEPNPK